MKEIWYIGFHISYKKIMKILHINCNYMATTLHQAMIEHLDKLGVINKVFVPVYSMDSVAIKPNNNVYVAKCFRKWDRIFFDYKQKEIFKSIQQVYKIGNFDCIHAYTLFTDGNCAMRLSKKYGMPYVVAVRDTDVNTFLKYRVYLRNRAIQIMKGASAIFFLSNAYKRLVFDKYVPAEYKDELLNKSYVIPNGIDDFWLENTYMGSKASSFNRISNKELRIIYAGQIIKRKNITLTQKAIQLLRNKGWKVSFTIVGEIKDEKEYKSIMQYPETTYIERQSKDELIKLFRKNDIFVMPSVRETFGLVYAEAISQNLPVVYTKGQGFDEQFPEGMVGFHANSSSSESVESAIMSVLDNYEGITDHLSEKAQNFCWDKICRLYIQIYNKIIKYKE